MFAYSARPGERQPTLRGARPGAVVRQQSRIWPRRHERLAVHRARFQFRECRHGHVPWLPYECDFFSAIRHGKQAAFRHRPRHHRRDARRGVENRADGRALQRRGHRGTRRGRALPVAPGETGRQADGRAGRRRGPPPATPPPANKKDALRCARSPLDGVGDARGTGPPDPVGLRHPRLSVWKWQGEKGPCGNVKRTPLSRRVPINAFSSVERGPSGSVGRDYH